ncbi:MAG: mRNA interferase HigB [Firmicutes bacterium ADurb.Bin354]|nr:MAG: mRNA interferase HigB [Firmicutes bacterium ADurb.Bin354]
MRIFSRGTLREFWEKYLDARSSLEFWYSTVEGIDFVLPNDVLAFFKNADTIGNNRIVFNIANNKYRLIVKFVYERKFAFVRFIGTHKEYDKLKDINKL